MNTSGKLSADPNNLDLGIDLGTKTWIDNGTAVCTAINHQDRIRICSDGAGGAIVAWKDDREIIPELYAQRIGADGTMMWSGNGTAVCTIGNIQEEMEIISDGQGGAIIVWEDTRSGNQDIFAQRLDPNGNGLWTFNGEGICTDATSQSAPSICEISTEKFLIMWYDSRNGLPDIYAQLVDLNGNPQWTLNGLAICNAQGSQYLPKGVSDGVGGAIITWYDTRVAPADSNIYAQRVNSAGIAQWAPNGTLICNYAEAQSFPQIVSDGEGGAIIVWRDHRRTGGIWNIYGERVNAAGVTQWQANGTAICALTTSSENFDICSDENGGVLITWSDYRETKWDIYIQKMHKNGYPIWQAYGVEICDADLHQFYPKIVSDGQGGAVVTWQDSRAGDDIYAQYINSTAHIQWAQDGMKICTLPSHQWYPVICNAGSGNIIIVWDDDRLQNGVTDVFAQRITIPSTEAPIPSFEFLIVISGLFCLIILFKLKKLAKSI